MRRARIALGSIAASLLVVACAGSAPTPSAGGAPAADVEIVDFAFAPKDVTIEAGQAVRWTNTDDSVHDIALGSGLGTSPQLLTGDIFDQVFDDAGSYTYLCGLHPLMTGTVTVTD